ncbi:hybrid sensor histidine kinase/response regulator [Anaerolineae bacterium CFX8]|nr:hybrid sensor histidine kinase/response regulator [Anaerolineae bacterium CFX8]
MLRVTNAEPKATILVVEDDIHLLEGIRDILRLDHYRVLTAQDGVQALEILNSQLEPPDLIVSDIMMPHMDGVEFFRRVRQQQRWLSIPFIFLTAKGEKSDYHKGLRLGVDDYIVKPYDPADLLVKIEARIKRQEALNQAHSESLSKLKRQILTILNHEFRTPLTFVVAYADMLNDTSPAGLAEGDMLAYLKGVGAGAERLRSLIENFILLVELETGDAQQIYEWRKCPISDWQSVFEDACKRAKIIQARNHRLDFQIADQLPMIEGDPEYLAIAITHLLTNAAKFSEPGQPIMLGAYAENDSLTIWVRDEGRGIPLTELERIWESFYQVDRATYEDQGAGAGLAIVRGVARLHGGSVGAASELGVGSTFKIILPIEKPAI